MSEYAEYGFDQQRLIWYVCRLWDMVFYNVLKAILLHLVPEMLLFTLPSRCYYYYYYYYFYYYVVLNNSSITLNIIINIIIIIIIIIIVNIIYYRGSSFFVFLRGKRTRFMRTFYNRSFPQGGLIVVQDFYSRLVVFV